MLRLPWEPIRLIPLGDIQAGIEACDLGLLKRAVQRGVSEDAWFIGMGDYLDVASPSNRKMLRATPLYDSVRDMMDAQMRKQEDDLMEVLYPTTGRWLGMLEGHHTWEYQTGETTDTNLCRTLGAPFLGHCGLIRLNFQSPGTQVSCTIFAHHGVGSGTSVGAPLVKLERVVEWCEADLYLMGHQHKRVAGHIPRFYMTNGSQPELLARERLLVGTGSYLRGYLQGGRSGGRAGGSYVEQAMMRPVSLGSPTVLIRPVRAGSHNLIEFETMT